VVALGATRDLEQVAVMGRSGSNRSEYGPDREIASQVMFKYNRPINGGQREARQVRLIISCKGVGDVSEDNKVGNRRAAEDHT
jgi:hypothetical protein